MWDTSQYNKTRKEVKGYRLERELSSFVSDMFVYIVNPKESKRKELLELVVNLASWSYFRPNFGKIWSELLQFFLLYSQLYFK